MSFRRPQLSDLLSFREKAADAMIYLKTQQTGSELKIWVKYDILLITIITTITKKVTRCCLGQMLVA